MAHEVHRLLFGVQSLYERDGVMPPCEYYVPTTKESVSWDTLCGREPSEPICNNNVTAITTLTFSPQVNKQTKNDIFTLF